MARDFRDRIYGLSKVLPRHERYNLFSQMRRAAVSLTNNIAEGYGRYHFAENVQFCRQSRGSLFEPIDDLSICVDQSYIGDEEYDSCGADALHLLKVLNGYIRSTMKLQQASGK